MMKNNYDLVPYHYESRNLKYDGIIFGRDLLDVQKKLKKMFGDDCIEDMDIQLMGTDE